jgi:hypothetical protein
MRPMKRRVVPAAVAALLCGVLAGCAIPTQGSPQTIPSSKVPFSLLNPHPPTTTTTTLPNLSSLVPVTVFFLNSSLQLQPEGRVVQPPAPLQAILTSLMAGPTQGEARSVTTALPNDVAVLSTTTQGNVVTVNMNSAFGQITGNNTELAVGQIVATVASENGNDTGVMFEIEGQHTDVPISNGSQVSGPVYLLEFLGPAA